MSGRIFIVAGDPSGERYAARLMAAWRRLDPAVEFFGIGGPSMEAEGLQSLVPLQQVSVVGFWEVARRIGFFRRLLERCEEELHRRAIRAVVLVDYPGFNLRLAQRARRWGVPVYYYIAPQVWAWGRWRLRVMAETVTLLLLAFPFECELFQRAGVRCVFVGHPLMDEPELAADPPPPEERPLTIALLPGSRPQELQRHVPLLCRTVELVRRDLPEAMFRAMFPAALPVENIPRVDAWEWVPQHYGLLLQSRAGLVKVGTSTLEAALAGMPFVAFYRTSWLSYSIARMVVDVPSAVLVNVLLRVPVVPEFLQGQARPPALARALLQVLATDRARQQWEAFHRLRPLLGGPGVAERAAAILAEELRRHPVTPLKP